MKSVRKIWLFQNKSTFTDEPVSSPYDQTFEDLDLPVDQWKEYVWKEVQNFKHEAHPQ